MDDPSSPRLVLVTSPDLETARGLARALVGEGLLACANLVPGLTSIYLWQAELQEQAEVLLLGKTRAGCLQRLEQRVLELHPYDTPEFVVLAIEHVEPRYLAWLLDSTPHAS